MARRSIAIGGLRRNPHSRDELHYMLRSEIAFGRSSRDGDDKWNNPQGYLMGPGALYGLTVYLRKWSLSSMKRIGNRHYTYMFSIRAFSQNVNGYGQAQCNTCQDDLI